MKRGKNKTKIQTLLGLLNNEEIKAPLGSFVWRIPTYVGAVHILSSQPLSSLFHLESSESFRDICFIFCMFPMCWSVVFHGLMSSVMADILIREDQKKKRGKRQCK